MSKHSARIAADEKKASNVLKEIKKYPIEERIYSKELFMIGREVALLKNGLITEEQRMYLKTGYPGDIASSVSYNNGVERAEFFIKNGILPPEYLEENNKRRR